MPEITRKIYEKAKRYDRQQFQEFCKELYAYGYIDGMENVPDIHTAEIIEAVSKVKGIGSKKIEDIRTVIEAVFEGMERNCERKR